MKGFKFVKCLVKYQRHKNSNIKFWPFWNLFGLIVKDREREARKAALQKSGGSQRLYVGCGT